MPTSIGIRSLVVLGALVLSSCSTTPRKAEMVSGANPSQEINRVQAEIDSGYGQHFDVLAPKDFEKAQSYLHDARKAQRKGRSADRVLNDVAYAQAYYDRAGERVAQVTPRVEGILQARTAAWKAGARNTPLLRESLFETDKQFRSEAKGILSPSEFAELQTSYLNIELAAINNQQLGNAIALVEKKAAAGRRKAPATLRMAEKDIINAQNAIATNRNDPSRYSAAVAKANASASLLGNVLAVIERKGAKLNEMAALEQVRQSRQIQSLQGQLGSVRGQLSGAETNLKEKNAMLSEQDRELAAAKAKEDLQALIEQAQSEFGAAEAETFQQENRLIIRLKGLNFPSGSANIPASALPLLAKVKTVAEELNPKEIVVQGHTDSIGSEQVNRALSEKRADAVAEYLESSGLDGTKIEAVGESYNRPIAPNRSARGRAENRRVDVIITATLGDATE